MFVLGGHVYSRPTAFIAAAVAFAIGTSKSADPFGCCARRIDRRRVDGCREHRRRRRLHQRANNTPHFALAPIVAPLWRAVGAFTRKRCRLRAAAERFGDQRRIERAPSDCKRAANAARRRFARCQAFAFNSRHAAAAAAAAAVAATASVAKAAAAACRRDDAANRWRCAARIAGAFAQGGRRR